MKIKLGRYRHFKGGEYEVMGVGKDSETLEDFVVYKSLYQSDNFPKGSIWIRKADNFIETIEKDGKKIPRFKCLGKE